MHTHTRADVISLAQMAAKPNETLIYNNNNNNNKVWFSLLFFTFLTRVSVAVAVCLAVAPSATAAVGLVMVCHGVGVAVAAVVAAFAAAAAAVAAVVGFLIGPTETAKLCRGCSGFFCLPSTGKVFKIRVCKKTALLETTTCPARRR